MSGKPFTEQPSEKKKLLLKLPREGLISTSRKRVSYGRPLAYL